MTVKVINRSSNPLPKYATPLSAGLDVRADNPEPIVLSSGLAAKKGVTVLNAPGTIDADYRGEVCVILVNLSDQDFTVERGERIAQLVLARHEHIEWQEADSLSGTDRGEGGFGSTGTK